MKKCISVLLALALMFSLAVPAFAANENTFTFDLSADGDYTDPHDIKVELADSGDTIITVLYRITVDEPSNKGKSALTQDEIAYDDEFFELVDGSLKTETTTFASGMSSELHTRGNGVNYVYFFNPSAKGFSDGTGTRPSLVGSFQLKIIATSGSGMVYSRPDTIQETGETVEWFGAKDTSNVPYKKQAVNLKVTIAGSKEDAGVSITAPAAKTYGDSTFTVSASAATPGTGTQTWSWVSADPTVLKIVSGANTATPTIKILKADTSGVKLTAAYSSDTHEGTADATIVVNKATLTPSIDTVADKPYDGTTTGSGTIKLTGAKNDDAPAATGTFAWTSKDAGTSTVNVTNIALTGTWGDKYILSATDLSDKAAGKSISPKTLTKTDLEYTGAAITKTYDGNTSCSLTSVSVKTASLIAGDSLTVNGTAVYNDADVADANKVTFTPTAITTGNYRLAANEKLDNIPASITKANQTPNITSTASLCKGGNTLDLSTLVTSGTYFGDLTFTVLDGETYGTIGTDNKTLTSTDALGEVKIRVKAAGDGNHNAYDSGTGTPAITVTVSEKADANVTFTGTVPETKTYGDAQFMLNATKTSAGTGTGTWTWTSNNTDVLTVDDTGKVTVIGAGEATITAKYESETTVGTVSQKITVNKATLTPSVKSVGNKTYDGTTTVTDGIIALTGAKNGESPAATGTFAWTSKDAGTSTVNVTDIALTGTWGNNYKLSTDSLANAAAGKSISPKTLTKTDLEYTGTAPTKVYDGNTTCTLPTAVNIKATSLFGEDKLTITGTAVYNSANVNEANKVTFTPTAITTGNYRLAASEKLDITPASITKANQAPNITSTASLCKGGNTLDLSTLVEDSFGDLSFEILSGNAATLDVDRKTLTSASTTGDVTIRVQAEGDDNHNPYDSTTAAITVSVVDKQDAGVSIDAPGTKTYGDAQFMLNATKTNAGTGTGKWTWTSNNTDVLTVDGTGKVTVIGAGEATITAKYESETTVGSKTVTIKVNKATLTPSVKSVGNKTYDGTTTATDGIIALTGAKNGESPAATGTFTWTAAAAGTSTVNVTGITLTSNWGDNYELSTDSLTNAAADKSISPITLTKADLEYTGEAPTKKYDGTTNCTFPEGGKVQVKDGVLIGDDTLPITGTAVYNSANVNEANKVTFTPTAITTGNYRLAASETLDITPASITKADAKTDVTGTISLSWETTGAQTVEVSLFPAFSEVEGAAIVSVTEDNDLDNLIASCLDNTFTLATLDSAAEEKTATLEVVISSDNYEDTTAVLTVVVEYAHDIFYEGDEHVIFAKDLTESAGEGETVSFTFKIRPRYIVDTVTVKTANGDKVKVRSYNGVYSFVMPDEDVTVIVTSERKIISSEIVLKDDSSTTKGETNPETGAPVEAASFAALAAVIAAGACFACRKNKETK